MTVASTNLKVQYTANGIKVSFAYPFKIFNNTDLVVITTDTDGNDTTHTLTTEYTVTGVGDENGGNVVFITPPDSTDRVTITRILPLTQATDYVENDPFPAEVHEEVADKLTYIAQQLDEEIGRAVTIPTSDPIGTTVQLPTLETRASKWLACDSSGDIIATDVLPASASAIVSSFMTTLLDDADAATARTTLGAASTVDHTILRDKVISHEASASVHFLQSEINIGSFSVSGHSHPEYRPAVDIYDALTGHCVRPLFEYSTTSAIVINGGWRHHHNGTVEQIVKADANITYTFTGLGTSEWQYLYIDDSELSGPIITSSQLTNSTSAPSWSVSKGGYYNSNDKCIGMFRIDSSGNIKKFHHINDFLRWDTVETLKNAAAVSYGSWDTVTAILPSICRWTHCTFFTDGSEVKDRYLYWKEPDSAGTWNRIGYHYEDDGGDNQGHCHTMAVESRIVCNSSQQFEIRASSSGIVASIWQNGYWLPRGM